jgi:hypothetical protein
VPEVQQGLKDCTDIVIFAEPVLKGSSRSLTHSWRAHKTRRRTGVSQLQWCILDVPRSGYWAWQRRHRQTLSVAQQAKQRAESCLRLLIQAAHRKGHGYYGARAFVMNYAIRAFG